MPRCGKPGVGSTAIPAGAARGCVWGAGTAVVGGDASYGQASPSHGRVLLDANRIEDAEPLMWRSLDIFDSFGWETGHEHPYSHRVNESYQALRRAIESDERD